MYTVIIINSLSTWNKFQISVIMVVVVVVAFMQKVEMTNNKFFLPLILFTLTAVHLWNFCVV